MLPFAASVIGGWDACAKDATANKGGRPNNNEKLTAINKRFILETRHFLAEYLPVNLSRKRNLRPHNTPSSGKDESAAVTVDPMDSLRTQRRVPKACLRGARFGAGGCGAGGCIDRNFLRG